MKTRHKTRARLLVEELESRLVLSASSHLKGPAAVLGHMAVVNSSHSVLHSPATPSDPPSFTAISTAGPNPSLSGQPVTLTANVRAGVYGDGAPTGSVTFLDNGTSIGTAALAAGSTSFNSLATLAPSSLPVGTDTITAIYSGDSNFSTSTSPAYLETVVTSFTTTTTIRTSAPNPALPTSTQPLTYTATVTAPGIGIPTPTGTVTFMENGTSLATATLSSGQATATLNTTSLAIGAYSITAIYGGTTNYSGSTSAAYVQWVASTTSTNWSGYVVTPTASTTTVTSVSGTWTVPSVTSTQFNAYSAVWVGLDGFVSTSNTVEQIGTEQDVVNGVAKYYAWYELYPGASVTIPGVTITPGDTVSASVTSSGGSFILTLTDGTQPEFTTTVAFPAGTTPALSSAEWIVEAPLVSGQPSSQGGFGPLANFGTVSFTAASFVLTSASTPTSYALNGALPTGWSASAIDMIFGYGNGVGAGTSALVSSPATGAAIFTVTFASSPNSDTEPDHDHHHHHHRGWGEGWGFGGWGSGGGEGWGQLPGGDGNALQDHAFASLGKLNLGHGKHG